MEKEKKELTLRDNLAIDRTKLANQRTLLAFIGTTLHFVVLGITFARIEVFSDVKWLAAPLFVVAPLVLIIGILNYRKNKKDIDSSYAGLR